MKISFNWLKQYIETDLDAEQAARILGEEMRKAADLSVPLVADVNSGDTWYAAKG